MAERVLMDDLRRFVEACLLAADLRQDDARDVADALVTTDAMGVFTHGTKLLAGYLHRLRGGGYRAKASPSVMREGPGWAVVDGDSGLGQVGCRYAMRLAMQKARQVGIAIVSLVNTGHIGAAGYFASMAAREGCIAMVTGNDRPSVAGPGSRGPVLGSNPLAYAVPVADGDPIVLDIATAAVAGGKVYAAHTRGEPIPPTWLIDRNGRPTTDGSLYPANASLAPLAGHKGYGLGLWCEILSAVLPGGMMTWQVGSWIFDPPENPSLHNASLLAIDVGTITARTQFDQRIRKLIDEIHAAPTADGVDRVLLPGEREWNHYHRAQSDGIDIPEDVMEKLRLAGDMTGTPLTW